mgnify:CR=1 FL=1
MARKARFHVQLFVAHHTSNRIMISTMSRHAYTHRVGPTSWSFRNLAELLAKATPERSGDHLAGLAAESAQERVVAHYSWARHCEELERIMCEMLPVRDAS